MNKKILMVAPFPPPYHGMATATERLHNSEVKDHFEINIINTNSSVLKQQWGFSLKRIGQILSFLGVFLYKIIIDRPHLIYLTISQSRFGFLKDSSFIVIAKLLRIKTVIHFHGGLFELTYKKANPLLKRLMAYLLGLNEAAIVLTDSLKSLTNNIINEDKVWVIPNCVEQGLLISETGLRRKINSRKKNEFAVLYFSNLIKSKGYFDVLKAARELRDNNFKFVFAGSWDNEQAEKEMQEFVRTNHLKGCVDFVGPVFGEAKKGLLLDSDIFVLPTYYPIEGLPICLLEAMACGLPVITTCYRGIRDVVSEGENGFFVPARDPVAIAEKIKILAQDPELQLKMANNNIEKINRSFTEKIFAQNFITLFNTIVSIPHSLNS